MPSSSSPRRKRICRRASSSSASTTRWGTKNTPFNTTLRFPQTRRDSSQPRSSTTFGFSPGTQSEISDIEDDHSPPLTADDRLLSRRQSFPTSPEPQLPNQVYRLDMTTGAVRVVADGFDKCNGIAFDASGKVAYVYVTTELCVL